MCDCLVALAPATPGGVTLFAKNSDRPPNEAQDIAWFPRRRDRKPLAVTHIEVAPSPNDTLACVLSRPRWCWGAEHGVNEAGVAIGNEAIYTTLDPRSAPPALIGMDLVRLGLERGRTARQAVGVIIDLLERYGQGGSGHDPALFDAPRPYWSSFLIADARDAWVLETSGDTWATQRVSTTWAISNRTTIPAFDAAHRHPRQATERFVDARLAASRAVLAAGPTPDTLTDHLRSHDTAAEPGWSVCMHVDGVETTTASMVVELLPDRPGRLWIALGSPCRNAYRELGWGDSPPKWEDRTP